MQICCVRNISDCSWNAWFFDHDGRTFVRFESRSNYRASYKRAFFLVCSSDLLIFPCFAYEREQRVLRKNVTFQRRGNMWFESFGKTIVLFCTTYDRWLYWKLRNLLKYDSFIRHVAIVIKSSSFFESISNFYNISFDWNFSSLRNFSEDC